MDFEEEFGKFDGFEYKERKPTNAKVEGFGINDAPFQVTPTIAGTKIIHPAYRTWKNMLRRCYSKEFKIGQPTYIDVVCDESWLSFSTFSRWFRDNYIVGYHLDKDLLVKDNTIYSPKTCIFITSEINTFLTLSGRNRGSYPLGVNLHHGRFQARIRKEGLMKHLGVFNSKELAHQAWQKAKLEQAIAFNFPPLQRVIDQLKFEIENNLETTTL